MHSRRESNALSCNAMLSCRCLLREAMTDEREKKKIVVHRASVLMTIKRDHVAFSLKADDASTCDRQLQVTKTPFLSTKPRFIRRCLICGEAMPSESRPSMAIVPPAHLPRTQTDAHSTLHPETGVHDAMRHGLRSMRDETAASAFHPIQHRLENWDETQRNWKMTMNRNTFGLGMPMRMMMERKFVSSVRTK